MSLLLSLCNCQVIPFVKEHELTIVLTYIVLTVIVILIILKSDIILPAFGRKDNIETIYLEGEILKMGSLLPIYALLWVDQERLSVFST